MIPILYEENNIDTTTNGLGGLPDAVSCNVVEERNGAYTLTMKYPLSGLHYSDIMPSRVIKATPSDGGKDQLFRIYKISRPKNGIVTVYAEHISYQLSHIPVNPFSASSVSEALSELSNNSVEENPFEFWTDKETQARYKQTTPESIRARLGGQSGSILDVYGGEYEFDNYTVKLHANRGQDKGITLRYGKNITDITQEENIDTTITGVLPYWFSETDGLVKADNPIYASTVNAFPYHRTKVIDFSSEFQEKPTQEMLVRKAQSYIDSNNIGYPKVNIKVSFIALWQTEEYKNIAPLERVNLCDVVSVYFEKLGISTKAKVIKTDYDVLKERYNSIELGDSSYSLANTITDLSADTSSKIKEAKSVMQNAIISATSKIKTGLGGYVVAKPNANGVTEEILIMDKPDIEDAVNVWRWNKNGLGFSSTGYNGSYETAITADGKIVADFITAGKINANMIKTGTLQGVSVLADNGKIGNFEIDNGALVGSDSGTTCKLAPFSHGANSENDYNIYSGVAFDTSTWFTGINYSHIWVGRTSTTRNDGVIDANEITDGTYLSAGSWSCKANGSVVTATNSGGSMFAKEFNKLSDRRLKKNIKELAKNIVSEISKEIKAVSFKWKNGDSDTHYGYIAQDIEKVLPTCVTELEGNKTVEYQEIHTILLAGLNARIEKLEAEIKELKGDKQ